VGTEQHSALQLCLAKRSRWKLLSDCQGATDDKEQLLFLLPIAINVVAKAKRPLQP